MLSLDKSKLHDFLIDTTPKLIYNNFRLNNSSYDLNLTNFLMMR